MTTIQPFDYVYHRYIPNSPMMWVSLDEFGENDKIHCVFMNTGTLLYQVMKTDSAL